MRFINPIPFIPFPLIKGRGRFVLREASPLFDSPLHAQAKEGEITFNGLRPFNLPLINDL